MMKLRGAIYAQVKSSLLTSFFKKCIQGNSRLQSSKMQGEKVDVLVMQWRQAR